MKIFFHFLIWTLLFIINESKLMAQKFTLGAGYYPYQRLGSESLGDSPNIDSNTLKSIQGSYENVLGGNGLTIKKGTRIEDSGRKTNKKIKLKKQDILSSVSISDSEICISIFALFSDYSLQKSLDPKDNLKPFLCKLTEKGKILSVKKNYDEVTSIIYQSTSIKLIPHQINEDKFCNKIIDTFSNKRYFSQILMGKTPTSKMGIAIWGTSIQSYISK